MARLFCQRLNSARICEKSAKGGCIDRWYGGVGSKRRTAHVRPILASCLALALVAGMHPAAFAGNGAGLGTIDAPEPWSLALFGVGAAAVVAWRARRRK